MGCRLYYPFVRSGLTLTCLEVADRGECCYVAVDTICEDDCSVIQAGLNPCEASSMSFLVVVDSVWATTESTRASTRR